jgi:hypothetical protein
MQTAADRKIFLRGQYGAANSASVSLGSKLYAEVLQSAQFIGSGGPIIGTSGNGRSVSFAIPDRNKFTTGDDKREMIDIVIDVYETALVTLSLPAQADTDTSKNTSIFNAMMDDDRMKKVTQFHVDHTLGRWPSGSGFLP